MQRNKDGVVKMSQHKWNGKVIPLETYASSLNCTLPQNAWISGRTKALGTQSMRYYEALKGKKDVLW